MDAILNNDRLFVEDAVMANDAFIHALWNAHPDRMAATGNRRPEHRPTRRLKRRHSATSEWQPAGNERHDFGPPPPFMAATYVVRDPCIRCGVRGDIGCEHRP